MNFILQALCFISGVVLALIGLIGSVEGFTYEGGVKYHWPGFVCIAVAFLLLWAKEKLRQKEFPRLHPK